MQIPLIKGIATQAIRSVNARIREERTAVTSDTRQMSWVDWLQQQATNGRNDALEELVDEIESCKSSS